MISFFVVISFIIVSVDVFTHFVGPSDEILLIACDEKSGIMHHVRSYTNMAMLHVFDYQKITCYMNYTVNQENV